MNVAIFACVGAMLVFGIFSVLSRHLINAAISLAAVSAACGVLMYVLGAHTAAIFEVSVCSGLVTVIFISAVSLSNGDKQASAPEKRAHLLPIILVAVGAVLMIAAVLTGFSLGVPGPVASARSFDNVFWETRQADIFGQMVAIIAGASAIVVFFKESEKK